MSYFDSSKIKSFKGKMVRDLITAEFEQILLQGEGLTVEFKHGSCERYAGAYFFGSRRACDVYVLSCHELIRSS